MVAREIIDNDEYLKWVALHPQGLVLNTATDPAMGDAVLHFASCPHIAQHKTGQLAGSNARKFVAERKQEMRDLARELGRSPGKRWKSCNTCGA